MRASSKIITFLMLLILCTVGNIFMNNSLNTYASSLPEVTSVPNAEIAVTDIDLGEYKSVMTVGEKQLLSITLLPFTATPQTITYSSNNTSVVTINAMGRITAVAVGNAQITVSHKDIKRVFDLTVQQVEPSKAPINVNDIEVADYSKDMEVNKTLSLSATVLPSDATNNKLTYTSNNPAVATVSSTGVVKGIAPGDVEITLSLEAFLLISIYLKTYEVIDMVLKRIIFASIIPGLISIIIAIRFNWDWKYMLILFVPLYLAASFLILKTNKNKKEIRKISFRKYVIISLMIMFCGMLTIMINTILISNQFILILGIAFISIGASLLLVKFADSIISKILKRKTI